MENLLLLILFTLICILFCQNTRDLNNINDEIIEDGGFRLNLMSPIFKDFINEWEKHMTKFYSQYTYSIPIKYRTQVEYYENITKVPCVFKGVFFYDEAKTKDDVVDFKIISPNNKVIYQASSVGSIFSLNLTHKGLYTITFNNRYINKVIRPILMVNSGQNLVLEKENLSETEKKMDSIISFLQNYAQDIKLTKGINRRENEELFQTNKNFYIFSLIETIALIGVSIWQYFYLKHLFEIKGSI